MALSEKERKKRDTASRRKYYLKNKARLNKKSKDWANKNRARTNEICKLSREKNKHKYKSVKKDWDKSHPEQVKSYAKKTHKKRCSSLNDSYVSDVVANHSSLTSKDIPQSLIEAKRVELKLKRLIKEQ